MSFRIAFFETAIYKSANIITADDHIFGLNKKGITIVCSDFETAENKEFLSKILLAVNSDLLQDAAIWDVSISNTPHWAELLRKTNCNKAIFFGVSPEEMGLHIKIPQYALIKWQHCVYLLAGSLNEIREDKIKKSQLWRELQLMFAK
jgi:hypothetical protein